MSLNPSIVSGSHRKAVYGLAALCLLVLISLGGSAAIGFIPRLAEAIEGPDPTAVEDSQNQTLSPESTEPQASNEQMSAEVLVITPRGFEPDRITRPAGKVLLVVINRSELESITLRLERENGKVIGQMQMPRNRHRWSMPATLPAGRYRVVDINRPEVVCNIEITS